MAPDSLFSIDDCVVVVVDAAAVAGVIVVVVSAAADGGVALDVSFVVDDFGGADVVAAAPMSQNAGRISTAIPLQNISQITGLVTL